ncbi:MAG: hypothetical protein UT36_C0003G0013 [Candidatus Peregrinibacteria bacterium GW2011_GWF2_39_17]|nr:MAG: hypothetical protein UT36_C0003G0013 [Candidatus Peregrinibacteria bacterium GW2011_GWF2_39_17]HCW32024.1 hypothetical protein [Candidatus Peregrinibacteria bacterium]
MSNSVFLAILSRKNDLVQQKSIQGDSENFLELIVFEFLETLFKNGPARQYFENRASYFGQLLVSEDFLKIQTEIKEGIMKLEAFVNKKKYFTKAAEDFQKSTGGAWGYLGAPFPGEYGECIQPSEFAKLVFNLQNYANLDDSRLNTWSIEDGKVSFRFSVVRFFAQYSEAIAFLDRHLVRAFLKLEPRSEHAEILEIEKSLLVKKDKLYKLLFITPKEANYIKYETLYMIYEIFVINPTQSFIKNIWIDLYKRENKRTELKEFVQSVFDDISLYLQSAVTKDNYIDKSEVKIFNKPKPLLIYSTKDSKICYSNGGFYFNDEEKPFYALQQGKIPKKLWSTAQEKGDLFLVWSELNEKIGMKRADVEGSINKTHRRHLFKKIKEAFSKNRQELPQNFFDLLLRNGTKERMNGIFFLKS